MRSAWLKIVIAVLVLAALGALAYRSQGAIHLADFSWSRLWVEVAGTRKRFLLGVAGGRLRGLSAARVALEAFLPLSGTVLAGRRVWADADGVLRRCLCWVAPAEPIRPLLLARRCRMAVSSMFGIYVLERLFDTAATAVLAGSSLLLFRRRADGRRRVGRQDSRGRRRAAGRAGRFRRASLCIFRCTAPVSCNAD